MKHTSQATGRFHDHGARNPDFAARHRHRPREHVRRLGAAAPDRLLHQPLLLRPHQHALVSPAGNHLGWFAVLVPVAGGLVIGFMAHYGSERIRGHGIPEALESILINGSKVQPRLAILKPLSSAISIGSGGPFGAEGPIIMTGGAIGSVISQLFHLTAAERKTLLVAGAAAGMSATFATPVAAVLLAVELLLFEWKPRSAIPGGSGQRDGGRGAPLHSRARPAVPGAAACHLHRTAGACGMRGRRPAGGRPLGAADAGRLCGGRCVPETAHSLEVVARHRRRRRRDWAA